MSDKYDYSKDTFYGAFCEVMENDFTGREKLDILLAAFLTCWFAVTLGIWLCEKSLITTLQIEGMFFVNIFCGLIKLLCSLKI